MNTTKKDEALKLALEYIIKDLERDVEFLSLPAQQGQREAAVIDRIIAEHGYPKEFQEFEAALKARKAEQPAQQQEPVAYITPLMEQQMFDDWCPYKGNPDPRVVWAGAVEAVNGLLLGAIPAQQPAQQQEPVAWEYGDEIFWHNAPDINDHIRATGRPLMYADTSPQSKPWVGLTDEEFKKIKESLSRQEGWDGDGWDLALKEAIEAKLREKNT